MRTIKKINGISGGDPCRCLWEKSQQHYETEDAGCPSLIPYFIRSAKSLDDFKSSTNVDPKSFCRALCCENHGLSTKLRQAFPSPASYEYNNIVYSCNANKILGYAPYGLTY